MQVRKLVKSGHSSLVMAVPKDWIKENKLKSGDLVYIDDLSNKLLVSTESKQADSEKKEKVIVTDGKSAGVVVNEIVSAYMHDYFEIIIRGKKLREISKDVKATIVGLVALELIDESSEKIVARSFLNVYDMDLKVICRRMDNIVRSMIIDTKELNDPKIFEDLVSRDREVNRLMYLVFKILKLARGNTEILNSLDIEGDDIMRYWQYVLFLEKIGDRVKTIAARLNGLDQKNRKKFLHIFMQIEKFYKEAVQTFYQQSLSEANESYLKRNELLSEIEKFVKVSKCPDCSIVSEQAFDMLHNINDITRITMYFS